MTATTITEEEFLAQFQPHEDASDTAGLKAYGYQTEVERRLLEQAHAERRLWTYCMTPSGNAYIAQGFAFVNREFYLICAVPYAEGAEYEVTPEICFCESCGAWFEDVTDEEESVARSSDPSMCEDCLSGE